MKAMEQRRSIRKYQDKPVEREKLHQILESARLALSGNNTQPWTYIVVENKETKEKIVKADHEQEWMLEAPVFLVCVADVRTRIPKEIKVHVDELSKEFELKQVIRDSAISITHAILEAQEQGLSTCWTGWYKQDDVRPILGIPEDKFVTGIITLGYADQEPHMRPRKTLEEMVRYEQW